MLENRKCMFWENRKTDEEALDGTVRYVRTVSFFSPRIKIRVFIFSTTSLNTEDDLSAGDDRP